MEPLYTATESDIEQKLSTAEACLRATVLGVYRAGSAIAARVCTRFDDRLYCVEEDITDLVGREPEVVLKSARLLYELCRDNVECAMRSYRAAVSTVVKEQIDHVIARVEHLVVSRACESILAALRYKHLGKGLSRGLWKRVPLECFDEQN